MAWLSSLWHNTGCMIPVQAGLGSVSVIESEIVKLKAESVWQQIALVLQYLCSFIQSMEVLVHEKLRLPFFYDHTELSLINTIQSCGEERRTAVVWVLLVAGLSRIYIWNEKYLALTVTVTPSQHSELPLSLRNRPQPQTINVFYLLKPSILIRAHSGQDVRKSSLVIVVSESRCWHNLKCQTNKNNNLFIS